MKDFIIGIILIITGLYVIAVFGVIITGIMDNDTKACSFKEKPSRAAVYSGLFYTLKLGCYLGEPVD